LGKTINSNVTGSGGMFQNNVLVQAWLVLVLAISFGAALAYIQTRLSGVIAANKMNETLTQVPALVWGDDVVRKTADTQHPMEIVPGTVSVKKGQRTNTYSIFRVSRGKLLTGWVVKSRGQGYADTIEALIGMDPNAETITGLFILEQKETPGLGNKITFPEWRKQFVGKKTDTPLVVLKGAAKELQTIDAVTGATISSRSVAWIVNQTVSDIKGQLAKGAVQLSTEEQP